MTDQRMTLQEILARYFPNRTREDLERKQQAVAADAYFAYLQGLMRQLRDPMAASIAAQIEAGGASEPPVAR